MALSLEQDGQSSWTTLIARRRARRAISGCVNSVNLTRLASYLLAEVVYLLTYSCRGRLPRIMQT